MDNTRLFRSPPTMPDHRTTPCSGTGACTFSRIGPESPTSTRWTHRGMMYGRRVIRRPSTSRAASSSNGHIVYACRGGPLVPGPSDRPRTDHPHNARVPTSIQLREHWVNKPVEYLTAAHIAPDGSSAVFTARGEGLHFAGEERPYRKGQRGDSAVALSRCALSARRQKQFSPSPPKPARPSSGAIPPTAKASRSNGPTMPTCSAGTASLHRMVIGWRTTIRINGSGSSTPKPGRTNKLRNPCPATSPIFAGHRTAGVAGICGASR